MEPADSGEVCSRGLRGRARGGASHPSVEAEVNDPRYGLVTSAAKVKYQTCRALRLALGHSQLMN